MNRRLSTPVRQAFPELPEHDASVVTGVGGTSEGEAHPVVHLRLLWENRRLLTRVAICALLVTVLIAFLIPNRYKSTARLMPPDSIQSSGLALAAAALSGGAGGAGGAGALGTGLGSGLGSIATEMLGLKTTSDIFVGILSSRTVQDKLIQEFDLKKLYHDRRLEDTRTDLAEHTEVSIDRKSQIVVITVTDRDPKRSAAMAGAYVEELNRLVSELSTSSARRERIFLEGRLRDVTKDLESAEKDFSQFSSKNTAIDIQAQGKAMVEAVAALEGELIAAESELEGLKQIYAQSNVRVRSVEARIAELKRQLAKMGGKEEDLSAPSEQAGDSFYPSIRRLPLLGVEYADLYRRTRVEEAVFESLTKEYELAKVQEAKEIPTVKVLDSPDVPDKRSFPPRTLIVSLGTAFALTMAAAWIFGKTSWEETDTADPRKVLAQEVFGTFKASLPRFLNNGSVKRPVESDPVARTFSRRDDDEESH